MRRNHILIVCAALLATLPLIVHGCSCGHDFDFHLQSWLDAAEQLRHGTLLPRWAFSAAYNAGEPRFIFYPPLSWILGALLTLIFPIASLPAIYTFIALAAAGLAMHRLTSHFAPPNAALIAAMLYIANPYMLFTAFERTAYAELLAAAWLPLLFLAALRARPTVRGIALPIALLWLTNAPAAVMGCYALALIVITRIAIFLRATTPAQPGDRDSRTWVSARPLNLAATSIAGTALGLALPAFYLIPAAYERRFVQIAMAIIPNMRFQDNFLFGHTSDVPHNEVLHTASLLVLTLLIATIAVLTALWFSRNSDPTPELSSRPGAASGETRFTPATTVALAALTLCIAFLLTPFSTPLWRHLPELPFLQFPWRLLSVLAVVLALTIALLFRNANPRTAVAIPLSLALIAALTFTAIHNFRQPCDDTDLPTARAQAFNAHRGIEPTDEYTPNGADNDILRADNPPYWLSPDPADFAPGTTPNPAATNPNYSGTPTDTNSVQAPHLLAVNLSQPETLILNLRDYPAWDITRTGPDSRSIEHPIHVQRDDGLLAIALPRGESTIDIRWHRTLDQQLGLSLSAIAACIYAALILRARSRRIEV
jgi:hypothetical protein